MRASKKIFMTKDTKVRAAITAIEAYLPEYILTNDELSRMVDTSDEWIMTRVGIRERRILKEPGHFLHQAKSLQ